MRQMIHGKCVDISSEGLGIIKANWMVILVPNLLLNEEADVEIQYQRAGVFYARIKKIYKLSEERIKPLCPVSSACGGCTFQNVSYDYELKFKKHKVEDALKRIGHIDTKVNDVLGMEEPYHYRNKIQVPFARQNKHIVFGFYRSNSHEIIVTPQCYIEDKKASPILHDICHLMDSMHIEPYNEDTRRGIIRHVLIRTSHYTDEVMVVLVTTQMNFPGQRNFVNELVNRHPEITTIVENVNSRRTNVILGDKEKVLYGPGHIKDDILGLTFEISASSFFQINPEQVEKLYETALKLVDPSKEEVVLDAYSGVGTIGLIAARNAKKVISVEINKSAHKNAIENAKRNNVNNIQFLCDDAGKFISKYVGNIDVLIMDPPRSGSDETFLSTVINKRIKKIIYVSCNPETLARDVEYLSKLYEVNYVRPVDMFPMTSHVETVANLILRK